MSTWTVQRRLAKEMLLQSCDSLAFPLFNLKGYPMKKILIASAILCFASAQAMAQTTAPVGGAPVPAAAAPAAGATGAAVGGTVAGLSTSALIAIGAAVAVVAGAASSDSTTAHTTPTHH
ncbi:hypothetical protein [Janthinobacterium sp. RB2P8]|uniref:hypothetical protein n=1 Tax=Janthinobacterium sp. RB2P8 TaxID=3424191 RepID=UPI003F23B682